MTFYGTNSPQLRVRKKSPAKKKSPKQAAWAEKNQGHKDYSRCIHCGALCADGISLADHQYFCQERAKDLLCRVVRTANEKEEVNPTP